MSGFLRPLFVAGPSHACAAVCDSVTWHGEVTEFCEDWDNVDSDAWEGMRMHALLAMVPELQRTIAVDFYAAKTIDEVLSQRWALGRCRPGPTAKHLSAI